MNDTRALAAPVLLLVAAACGGAESVPLPDVEGLEAPVQAKIRRCHQAVLEAPTAASWGRYARTLDAHGKYAEAERAYLAAAGAATGKAAFDHLHLAGNAIYELSPQRAMQHLRRALELRDDVMATYLYLAGLEEEFELFDDARRHYEQAASRWSSSHARLGLGRVLLQQGDAAGALRELEIARQLDPKHRQVYEALARAYARLGRTAESRAAAKQAGVLEKLHPIPDPLIAQVLAEDVQASARFRRGFDLAVANRNEEAIVEFRAGLEARPDDVDARHMLSLALARTGKIAEAEEQVAEILTRDPGHAGGLEMKARILVEKDDRDAARRAIAELLRVDPKNAWARSQLRR